MRKGVRAGDDGLIDRTTKMISNMSLQPKDVHGQRICVISGKFLPTYAQVQVGEESGQIGLLFDTPAAPDTNPESGGRSDVVSTNKHLPPLASLQWYGPELLSRIYEVRPGDLEFGLGCPFAIKEADLTECSRHSPPPPEANQGMRL